MTAPERELLTVAEVAAILRLSRQTVYELIAAGKLLSSGVGLRDGRKRISRAQLDAYLAGSQERAAPVATPAPRQPVYRSRRFN